MKHIAVILSALVAATACGGTEVSTEESAEVSTEESTEASTEESTDVSTQDIAVAYFEALTGGDVDRANELSTVPYSLEGRKVLTTLEELADLHAEVASSKGEREMPPYTMRQLDGSTAEGIQLDADLFPAHDTFEAVLNEGDESLVVLFVSKGDDPKVIGFKD